MDAADRRLVAAVSAGVDGDDPDGVTPTGEARTAAIGADADPIGLDATIVGRLPAAEREIIVDETCAHRGRECVALLAEWTHDEPSSEARQRVSRTARRNREANLRLVGSLSSLYGEDSFAADGSQLANRARRTTDLFASYYHHAAPFSRELLVDLWQRCTEDPSQLDACLEAREQLGETFDELEISN